MRVSQGTSTTYQPHRAVSAPLPFRTSSIVGRTNELSDLQQYLDSALQGQRQVVFVTGEPGIGKTTLIQAFLDQISVRGDLLIGQGQCIDHYGTGEGYLPVLDALGQALRGSEGERLLRLLGRYAPTWLTHLPAFLSATDMEAIQRKTQGATRERMLREIAEALEALTAEQLLVFVLEDLHWSDASTVDLLSFVARRRQSARLLIIGTYRPDMIVREHPLRRVKQELQAHDLCREVAVHLLSAHDVDEYLTQRFPHN